MGTERKPHNFDPTVEDTVRRLPAEPDDQATLIRSGRGAGDQTKGEASLPGTVTVEDLSSDKLLQRAARITFEEKSLPTLGGIHLLAKLGQGGMGAVYYGVHSRLDQEVAVKVLPPYLADEQPKAIERFIREAKIAARIRSPHLVTVTDLNQENDLYYIVMEFVRGESAAAYLRQIQEAGGVGLSEAEALDICIAATEGLAAAHAEGVIHRDIKPDNILIPQAKSGDELLLTSAKLADLGLAREIETDQTLTGSRASIGTPGYMSPEQIADAKRADKTADVFSMGCTLYVLVSGSYPFAGNTPMEKIMSTIQKRQKPLALALAGVTTPTSTLVERCLAKEPRRRYPDGQALLEALKGCRAALPSGTQPQPGVAKPAPSFAAASIPHVAPAPTLRRQAARPQAAPPPAAPQRPARPQRASSSADTSWLEENRDLFRTLAQAGGILGPFVAYLLTERIFGEEVELIRWLMYLAGSVLAGWCGGWCLGVACIWAMTRLFDWKR
jgi:serine/threonine protein kinase